MSEHRDFLYNGGWGNLAGARGNFFFGAGFRNIGISCIVVGEPGSGRGNFFPGLDFKTMGICFITVRGGTWIRPGELFSGAGFQNNGDWLHNGTWWNLDRAGGAFFFGDQLSNRNEG